MSREYSGSFYWQRRERAQLCCPHNAEHLETHSYRIERLGVWRNIRGTEITMDEAKGLVSQIKAMIPNAGS